MNTYQEWTPDDENELVELYDGGELTVSEIAGQLGRTTEATHARISKLKAVGRITATRRVVRLPDDLRNRVVELYNSGTKYKDIAKEVGESYTRIATIINHYRTTTKMPRIRGSRTEPVEGARRSTGSSALDAALETLRKELHVLTLQQTKIAEKVAHLRRTITRVERVME